MTVCTADQTRLTAPGVRPSPPPCEAKPFAVTNPFRNRSARPPHIEAISLPYRQFNRLMISASTSDPPLASIGAIRSLLVLDEQFTNPCRKLSTALASRVAVIL